MREFLDDTALEHVARDGELHQRRRLHLLPRAGRGRGGGDGERDHRDGGAAAARTSAARIEAQHGEDIAALFDIYVGRAHVYYNPKIRLERLIYRGIREAANASRSIEERERARRVADLRDEPARPRRVRRLSPDRRRRRRRRSSATRRSRAA